MECMLKIIQAAQFTSEKTKAEDFCFYCPWYTICGCGCVHTSVSAVKLNSRVVNSSLPNKTQVRVSVFWHSQLTWSACLLSLWIQTRCLTRWIVKLMPCLTQQVGLGQLLFWGSLAETFSSGSPTSPGRKNTRRTLCCPHYLFIMYLLFIGLISMYRSVKMPLSYQGIFTVLLLSPLILKEMTTKALKSWKQRSRSKIWK